ncbi:MAG: hypothetical protein JST82_02255 [Bacteroidetes bacterium]|nr:hypothetical protein [Bacteroidota bacterium]
MEDIKNTYEKIQSILTNNIGNIDFAEECLQELLHHDVIINKGSVLEREHAWNVYSTRKGVQENVTHADVKGYDSLLNNITNTSEQNIRFITIICEKYSYIIFSDIKVAILLGILKSPYSNIAKVLENEEVYKLQGIDSEYFKFKNGNLIGEVSNL